MSSDIEKRLAKHPFTKGMSEPHLKLLAQCAVPAEFAAGQIIFRVGEPANGFYLIEQGKVALEGSVQENRTATTDFVGAGEPLGWSWLFPPYLWHFDARATEPVTALCLSGILMRQHRDDDLAFSHELFQRTSVVMVRRLQHTRQQLLDLKSRTGIHEKE